MRSKTSHRARLRRRGGAHAIKNIASGAPSPAGRCAYDPKHRIGLAFGGGAVRMRSKTSHRALFRRRAGAHAIQNIASGSPSPADRCAALPHAWRPRHRCRAAFVHRRRMQAALATAPPSPRAKSARGRVHRRRGGRISCI